MLTTYCFTCHNTRAKIGGLALDGLDLHAAADDARIWEKALRKLRGHLMPPPGNPQPPEKDVHSFVAWMEDTLDSHAKGPKAGYVPIERLNRTEYAASVKALVGVDVNPKDVLPQDIQVDGFDNIAAALSVSPAFLDQYVTAARHVARLAIGDPAGHVSNVKYSIEANQNSDEPLPPGTRGGVRFKHNFPADGEYRINLDDLGLGLYTSTAENESTLVIMIDGKIVFRKPIGGPADQALVDRKGAEDAPQSWNGSLRFRCKMTGRRARCRRWHSSIARMWNPTKSSPTPSTGSAPSDSARPMAAWRALPTASKSPDRSTQPAFRNCQPRPDFRLRSPQEAIGEPACAKQITENLARRAFRRPVTAEDVAGLMPFYEAGREVAGASIRESSRWWRPCWPARIFSTGPFGGRKGQRRAPSLRSPTWNWLPVFHSSCGIPVRMRNC